MILHMKLDNSYFWHRMRFLNTIEQKKCFLFLIVSLASLFLMSSQIQASMNSNISSFEFLDNGRLTLNVKGVPLGTLLGEIQEKNNLELKIHKNHLEQPISVSFQSLPLNEAIKRILRGVSHACLFDSDSNVEKIITFPNGSKANEDLFHKSFQGMSPPYDETVKIARPLEVASALEPMPPSLPVPDKVGGIVTEGMVFPPKMEETEEALEIVPPPPPVENIVKATKGEWNSFPSEVVEHMEEVMVIDPPPEMEDISEDYGN